MSRPQVSVIIPTHNRSDALRQTLAALTRQMFPAPRFEVIVVDDDSADDTAQQVASMRPSFSLTLLRQQRGGAAAARNRGAAQAKGEILLFLDSDIIAAPQLIEQHACSHAACDHALVVGRRVPWPAARVSLLSQIIDLDTNVPTGGQATFQEAFSANLSLSADGFRSLGGFDEEFPSSGCEDVEFAYRATLAGLEIVYNAGALGHHNHPTDLDQACQKTYAYHTQYPLLFRKHPELRGQVAHLRDKTPIAWRLDPARLIVRKMARRILSTRPMVSSMKRLVVFLEQAWPSAALLRRLYWKILGAYQLRGLREGQHRYGPS